ncbi:MAG: hypothetical protein H7177_03560 [Rhizobacter sp.]|nr:hypothetical protein [Bacteriovorax sp.]
MTRIIIFSVVALLAAFTIGYYIGNDNSRRATVVPSTKDGLVDQKLITTNDIATRECNFRIEPGNNNEPKALVIDKLKLIDIDSYKVIGNKLFYTTGPVYGKPEIGIIDCVSAINKTIVFPENKQGSYPYGSDVFRLKKVTKKLTANVYNIQYWYGADVDKIDMKKFENDQNLKTFIFKND